MPINVLVADPQLASQSPTNASVSPVATFELISRKGEYSATAILQEGEFAVQAGSIVRNSWVGEGSNETSYAKLYGKLFEQGIIVGANGQRKFTSSYVFNSPSAASAVVSGRPSNGQIEWKLKGSGITFQEWEAKQVTFDSH